MEETGVAETSGYVHEVIGRHMLADGMPIVADLENSHGSQIYDSRSGTLYLDLFGCYATIALGYNHPYLTSSESLSQLGRSAVHKPSNSDIYTAELAAFVETFSRLAKPSFMRYLFFIEGGTLAVENALKIAFDWKVRKNLARGKTGQLGQQVIHFKQAFHGRSGYTLSLTNTADPRKVQYFPKFSWPRVSNPKCSFPLEGENLQKVIEVEKASIDQIKAAIQENPDDIACLILEPIQGEGGDNHFRTEFHQALRNLCDENDILLIHDEVQTGFGATGKMWACEHYVQPDIIAFGKKSQVCGLMAGSRIDEVPENVFHTSSRINSTWGGNLVDMVRCRLQLEVYERDNIVSKSDRVGKLLQNSLGQLQEEFPGVISNVRGRGLFCALDLPNSDLRDQFRRRLFEKGIIILGCGERSIRFRPALTIPKEDLFEGVQAMHSVLEKGL